MSIVSIDPVEIEIDRQWIEEYTESIGDGCDCQDCYVVHEQEVDFIIELDIDLGNLPPPPKTQEQLDEEAYNRAMGILK